ncbi:hypothetical protein MKX03_020225 [Papaver bracteatum]|nr:hypothetical protein MKX03_020225 [Papaver bracteatum]
MPSLSYHGTIVRLELENFKSYKGLQIIGPFYDFTAIIGPNGVGKSNLMDAISFVLGVKSAHLREKEQKNRRAFVKLVYQLISGIELQFRRTITSAGGAEYRLDEKVVTWDEYNNKAEEKLALVYNKKRTVVMERKQKKEQKEEADTEKTKAELEEEKKSLEEIMMDQEKYELENTEKRKEQSGHSKEITLCERKIAERKVKLDKMQPELLKSKEELSPIKKKKEEGRKHGEEIKSLESDFHQISKKLDDLHEKSQHGSGKLQLEDNKVLEYHRIKEEAGMKTAKLREEKEVQDRQQHADKEARKNQEENLQQLKTREQELELDSQVEQMQARQEKIVESLWKHKEERASVKKDLNKMQDEHRESKNKYESLNVKISEVEKKLRDLKAGKYENERDVRLSQAVGKPTKVKYNLVVTVAMGRFMDAVVYLKQQQLYPQTFIPLQSVRVKPVSEKLRTLGGTAKLIFDVIQFDPSLERVILYAVGNTLVCDKIEEAKDLSWSRERYKVVNVDGILLTKSGTMTGGISVGMEAMSKQWDDKAIGDIKKTKEWYELEMENLGSIREMQMKESEASGKISGLDKKIQYSEIEKVNIKDKLAKLKQEKLNVKEEISRIEPELRKLQKQTEKRKKEIDKFENRINVIVHRIYDEFSKSVGVKNIREYEESHLKRAQQKAELNSQLEYEQKTDMESRIREIESNLDSLDIELKRIQTKEEKDKQGTEKYETQIEQLHSQMQEIIEKCELEQIELPIVDDPMETGSSMQSPVFDYGQLSRSHQQELRPSEREKLDLEFKHKMDNLVSKIERTAPNLKALDQYVSLQEKEESGTMLSNKEDMNFLQKLSTKSPVILTRFTLGGTAYLNLENEDDPFLHGIKYTTMPPTKRFHDMEQLSGGEKTVAALALLFSIHSYKPSPFFILDEVDGALDNLNVAKVAGFIRSKSCENSVRRSDSSNQEDTEGGNGFQSIVISLKDTFYDKAQALVGVYRDSERGCSRTLTFDLTKYRE